MGRSAVTRHEPHAGGNFKGAGVNARHGASANAGHAGAFKGGAHGAAAANHGCGGRSQRRRSLAQPGRRREGRNSVAQHSRGWCKRRISVAQYLRAARRVELHRIVLQRAARRVELRRTALLRVARRVELHRTAVPPQAVPGADPRPRAERVLAPRVGRPLQPVAVPEPVHPPVAVPEPVHPPVGEGQQRRQAELVPALLPAVELEQALRQLVRQPRQLDRRPRPAAPIRRPRRLTRSSHSSDPNWESASALSLFSL